MAEKKMEEITACDEEARSSHPEYWATVSIVITIFFYIDI